MEVSLAAAHKDEPLGEEGLIYNLQMGKPRLREPYYSDEVAAKVKDSGLMDPWKQQSPGLWADQDIVDGSPMALLCSQ